MRRPLLTLLVLASSLPLAAQDLALHRSAVATTTAAGNSYPDNAVDGDATSLWVSATTTLPQHLTIDLGAVFQIDSIRVVNDYFSNPGQRFYHYTVAVSTDGSTFTTVAQKTDNAPATSNGTLHSFPSTAAQLVRLTITANSDNTGADAVAVEVFSTNTTGANSPLSIERLYAAFKQDYSQSNGDKKVDVRLGEVPFVTPSTGARGQAILNLIAKSGEFKARSLTPNARFALFALDNIPGPNKQFLPEVGDRALFLLGFQTDAQGEGGGSFKMPNIDRIELDQLVVVQVPVLVVSKDAPAPFTITGTLLHSTFAKPVLFGTRPFFERRFTAERLGTFQPVTSNDVRFTTGLVSGEVLSGADLFFDEDFNGNERSCKTCHRADESMVITTQFAQGLPTSDPLFVAHPNFTGNHPVPELEIPTLLDLFMYIRENPDGFQDPTNVFVMRSVPHTLSLSLSVDPIGTTDGSDQDLRQRTGWGGDGVFVPGLLRIFDVGAVIQHYTRNTFDRTPGTPNNIRLQDDHELDRLDTVNMTFGRISNLDLDQVSLTDPTASTGLTAFNSNPQFDFTKTPPFSQPSCEACHNNGGARTIFDGTNRIANTGVESQPNPARNIVAFPTDDGHGVPPSGGNQAFNIPLVLEVADTPPFFHNNLTVDAGGTQILNGEIEDAVRFYGTTTFANSPAAQALFGGKRFFDDGMGGIDETKVSAVGAFLRVTDAAINIEIAIQRVRAALIIDSAPTSDPGAANTSNTLLELAVAEIDDAMNILSAKGLNGAQVADLSTAKNAIQNVLPPNHPDSTTRALLLRSAKFYLSRAKSGTGTSGTGLGSGLLFTMGEANLTF